MGLPIWLLRADGGVVGGVSFGGGGAASKRRSASRKCADVATAPKRPPSRHTLSTKDRLSRASTQPQQSDSRSVS